MFDTEIDRLEKLLSIRMHRAQRELQEQFPYMSFSLVGSTLNSLSTTKRIIARSNSVNGHHLQLKLQSNVISSLIHLYEVKNTSDPEIARKSLSTAYDRVLFSKYQMSLNEQFEEVIEEIKCRTALKEPSESWKCIFREYSRRGLEFPGDPSLERREYIEICKKLDIPFEGMTYETELTNRVFPLFVQDSCRINLEILRK